MEGGEAPAPRLTIRVGQDVFDDVRDYVVLVRTQDDGGNAIRSTTSSYAWAYGAMEAMIAIINAHNIDAASSEDEE